MGRSLVAAYFALLICYLQPLAAQQAVYQRPINQDCIAPLDVTALTQSQGRQLFPTDLQVIGETSAEADHIMVNFAQGFEVEYYDSYKVVRNTLVNETYVLYQCGLSPPPVDTLPQGSKLFSIPLTSVSVLETVPLAFLSALGVDTRLHSVSGFAVGACGQRIASCPNGTAPSLDFSNPANDATAIGALAPFVDAVATSSAYLQPQTFAFSATTDPGVLQRAEWLKFLGLFFNMDAASSDIFSNINASYFRTLAEVQDAVQQEEPPVMAFIDFLDYEPDQAFEVQFAPYKLQFTEDAGAVPPVFEDVASTPGVIPSPYSTSNSTVWFTWGREGAFATQEEALTAFLAFLQSVDIVVDETYSMDPASYNLTTFLDTFGIVETGNYPFLVTGQVYREDGLISPPPANGLDWFEGAIVRPDLVLQDFAAAVAPQLYESHRPVWIRNIARGDEPVVQSAQNCDRLASCSATPSPICPYVSVCPGGQLTQQDGLETCVYVPCA